ncbi:Butirosin biosynthesis protein H, N-terminal [Paenibacillus sophorae]|uniref:BtrH N-terminal domain-containing protein n=1 Tax=Paenibacillus sophorae TaxID=1333845 RepID=A0A1H8UH09_9BACL|nr:BtrH N-terminal domain-containing protein [Paenibacillus sophorae]QWU13149.1 BtrH N-terminal domain-containing protein [Paenibacillus sophorae]SEP01888.1 Butirosin biosynthesis protein H, N-terminal [Paenibacillus sophorae]
MSIVNPHIHVQPGDHCLFASLRNMLKSGFGIDMPEADIYFCCDGMNVEYHPDERPFWLGLSGDAMLRHFDADGPVRLRYSFDMDHWPGKRQLLDEIAAELAAGRPVMLFAHSGCLTYHSIYRDNVSRPHVVFVYGMDPSAGVFHIGDSFLLDYSGTVHSYQGSASMNDLLEGLYGISFMAASQPVYSRDDHDWKHVLQKRIASFLDDGRQAEGGSVRGLQAYYAFIDRLENAAGMDAEPFANICKEVYYCLRIGSIMHQWTYFMQIVQEYPQQFRHGMEHWTEMLEDEHSKWKKHLLQIYKTGLRGDRARWSSILHQGRLLLDRLRDLLNRFVDDMSVKVQG